MMTNNSNDIHSRNDFEDTFNILYGSHFAILCVYAFRFVPDHEVCRDMVQESFARLWKNRGLYTGGSEQIKFLYTTLRNLALNNIRHEKVRNTARVSYDVGTQDTAAADIGTGAKPETVSDSIIPDLIESEVKGIIWRGIVQLPERHREILLLFLQGYSVNEISQKLKKPLQTVKNNKTIAFKLLRNELMKLYGAEIIRLATVNG